MITYFATIWALLQRGVQIGAGFRIAVPDRGKQSSRLVANTNKENRIVRDSNFNQMESCDVTMIAIAGKIDAGNYLNFSMLVCDSLLGIGVLSPTVREFGLWAKNNTREFASFSKSW